MTDWPSGLGRIALDQTDSTNAEAERLIRLGTPPPFWVTARAQTAGRGRRGRVWTGGEGNFLGTLALAPGCEAPAAALRSFVAALALYEALDELAGVGEGLTLKWPNDVLYRDRKLAGILLEGGTLGGRFVLRIGIGVNLATAPEPETLEEGAVPPVALDGSVTPQMLLPALARRFARWDAVLRADGFGPVRAAWLSHAARLGTTIRARTPGRDLSGVFETVDSTGALVLATAGGRTHLPAAEVHFG